MIDKVHTIVLINPLLWNSKQHWDNGSMIKQSKQKDIWSRYLTQYASSLQFQDCVHPLGSVYDIWLFDFQNLSLFRLIYSTSIKCYLLQSNLVSSPPPLPLAHHIKALDGFPLMHFAPISRHPHLSPSPRHRGISPCVIRPRLLAIMHAVQCPLS